MPVPRLNEAALQAIASHPLTGNVRELENLLHRAVALSEGDELQAEWQGATPRRHNLQPAPSPRPTNTPTARRIRRQIAPPCPTTGRAWLTSRSGTFWFALKRIRVQPHRHGRAAGISLRQIRYRIARLNIAVPNDQDFLDEIG